MILPLISSILRPLLRYWVRKAAPRTCGTLHIPGLRERVRVLWGPYGIPHVFAASEHDLFIAQGYLHAQERLWQMDLNRRFLSGRLAETYGDHRLPWKDLSVRFRDGSTVDLDYFIRLMGIRRAACASLRILPQESVARLLAYKEGVNRYIESHLKCLPLEFRLLRYEPEPWLAEDTLTIAKGFAFFLSTSLFTRLTWSAIAEKLKGQEEKLKSLLPAYPAIAPSITHTVVADTEKLLRFINGTFQNTVFAIGGEGSNNWVIAPGRSATGRALLCNDPHLRMTLPPVWYLLHLKATAPAGEDDAFEVWGASIPGSPCVYLGHNRHIAWGVTAALCDDADLYLERTHPKEPDRYLAGNEWAKMECTEEKILIRGRAEVKKRIRLTRHGPIISDLFQKNGSEEAWAFRWTAHDPSAEFRALYGVNRAKGWEQFLESLSHQVAPTLNYVYADTLGNIGYSLAGRVPIRTHRASLSPLPGWSGEFDWKGYIPFNQLPRLYNPTEGLIATANNRIADESYPYHLSDLFEAPYRIRRIQDLLAVKEKLSLEDMAEVQKDVVSLQAKEMIQGIREDLKGLAREDPALEQVAEALMRWDGNCSESSPEATISHLLHQRMMMNLLIPELGEDLYLAYAELLNQPLVPVDQILRNPNSPWFDSCPRPALIKKSLREAYQELTQRLGGGWARWNWGKLHTVTLHHPLDRINALAALLSLGPFPCPGDCATINLGFYRHSYPFQNIVGPSLRMLVDVGEWQRSRFILSSGQSGHPFSGHYSDQTDLWRKGEYIQLRYEEKNMKDWPLLILTSQLDSPGDTI